MAKRYKDGIKQGKTEITIRLLDVMQKSLGNINDNQLSKMMGVNPASISQWRGGTSAPQKTAISSIVKALMSSFLDPLAEIEPVKPEKPNQNWKLNGHLSLVNRLEGKCGFYIYYDSMGRITYVGQAKKNLRLEMEQRLSQKLRHKTYVGTHTGKKSGTKQMVQGDVVRYVSAYRTLTGTAAHNFEASFLRATANDIHTRKLGEFYWHVKKE